MKTIPEDQLRYLAREALLVLETVCRGFDYDPGCSDLDNEQPINVRMTLGDYRRASRVKYALKGVEAWLAQASRK